MDCKSNITTNWSEDGQGSIVVKVKLPGLLKKDAEHVQYDAREEDPYVPCAGCGWAPYENARWGRDYRSHHKLSSVSLDTAVRSLGGELIMKDRPFDDNDKEAKNLQFVRDMTTIPVPIVVGEWTEADGTYHILQEKMKGDTLEQVWPSLSDEARENIAKEVTEYVLQLRTLISDRIANLDGGECPNNEFIPIEITLPIMHNDNQVWSVMAETFPECTSEGMKEKLRWAMPATGPYTFSHGNLAAENIMVKDGHVIGLVNWEDAGYYPVWWEYARNEIAHSFEDRDWKELLCKHMKSQHKDNKLGRRWWNACELVRTAAESWGRVPDERLRKEAEEELDELIAEMNR
ncbi:kinase-like domain-containing protein [Xylariaceae sp. FL0255]|nr:kinase-like domain-containing protein [Xylariaceae sp. FL0255]